jgi:uncharacterized damage-inducible protein DinB
VQEFYCVLLLAVNVKAGYHGVVHICAEMLDCGSLPYASFHCPNLTEEEMLKELEPYVAEMEQEAQSTRKCFEQIPEDKMTWKPHEKSMSIGQLAMHTAMFPGLCTEIFKSDSFATDEELDRPTPSSRAELLSTFDDSLRKLREYLENLDETTARGNWKLIMNGQEIVSGPRMSMIRPLAMNHMYHHRGQLSVYLRLLDIPVPPIYGPTADFNPFVEKTVTP